MVSLNKTQVTTVFQQIKQMKREDSSKDKVQKPNKQTNLKPTKFPFKT